MNEDLYDRSLAQRPICGLDIGIVEIIDLNS